MIIYDQHTKVISKFKAMSEDDKTDDSPSHGSVRVLA